MASYHLNVRIISRSQGRSSVGAAAYRSCTLIRDERQGLNYDYRLKKDCVHSEIIAPDNAAKWMFDRSKLWNHIEFIETRKNSQLARDIIVALPKELTLDQNINLIRDFVNQEFISLGMVADLNIHYKDNNPHAHIMLTMRRIKGKGFGAKNEAREWNAKHHVLNWRERWAEIHNERMAQFGYDNRIDHRSFEEQGIKLIPQIKLGMGAYFKGSTGEDPELERVAKYKQIAFENGQRIIENPEIAITHLSRMQTTFTYDDILKYVHSHSDESQFFKAVQAIESSADLILIQENDYERYNRYTSRSNIESEKSMLAAAKTMAERNNHHIPEPIIEQAIISNNLSEEQATALKQTVNGGDLHVIIGHAGTGKTYSMKAIREVYEAMGYRIQGVALSAVAANGLEKDTGIVSTSIAKKLTLWEHDQHPLDSKTVLIVDEAGMVGTRQMETLIKTAEQAGAKIIPIGDQKQTQAVESGGAFRGLCEVANPSRLKQVWRQKEDWQIEATLLFSGDESGFSKGIDMYNQRGLIHNRDTFEEAASLMLTDFVHNYTKDDSSFMCTFKNEHADRLNVLARHHLKQVTKCIGKREYEINTNDGIKLFAKGDRILFLANDREMGVSNGTFGTVLKVQKNGCMEVELGDGRSVAFDTEHYGAITYGYAATVHKLQGATIDMCYVLASEGFDRHLSYVAMSRHRHEMNLYWSKDIYENLEHLKRSFSSLGEKELIKDFDEKYSTAYQHMRKLTSHDVTFSENQLNEVRSQLKEPDEKALMDLVVEAGTDRKGNMRYTTLEMVLLEQQLYDGVETLSERNNHHQGNIFIDSFLNNRVDDEKIKFALKRTLAGADLSVIETKKQKDKVYIAKLLAEAYKNNGYMVDAVSLSGAGADNFEKATGIQSTTTYKRLWEFENGKNLLNGNSVLFVDSANMLGTRVMEKLTNTVEKAGAKMIVLGDTQLAQSVSAGGAYRGIIEHCKGNVSTIDQEKEKFEWQDHAKRLLRQDQASAAKAVDMFAAGGMVHHVTYDYQYDVVVEDWFRNVQKSGSYKNNMMITYRNADVQKLNDIAREELFRIGYLEQSTQIEVENYDKEKMFFAAGDRIIFKRKDAELGVLGGTLGTVRKTGEDFLEVRLDDGTRIEVNTKLYNDLAHGYATNIYKSANMRIANTYILATKNFDKQSLASALDVHKRSARIYHAFKDYKKFRWHVSQPRDKELLSDYPMEKNAYRITVQLPARTPQTKYITIEPRTNQAHVRQELDREAKKFVQQAANRVGLTSEQMADVSVKVEQVPFEQYVSTQKAKDQGKSRDRGIDI